MTVLSDLKLPRKDTFRGVSGHLFVGKVNKKKAKKNKKKTTTTKSAHNQGAYF